MKFVLATTPIRPEPTGFAPVGATSLLDTMSRAGYDPVFYDINGLRPGFDEVVDFFMRNKPDMLGISAVVSTAYRYTKELSAAVKRVSPGTRIILGGCLAASAEILLRKCSIDICVIGEGEKVLMNLIKHWERFGDLDASRDELHRIKGIAFVDKKGDFRFTGYEEQLLAEELPQPNYGLLKAQSDIARYIVDPATVPAFASDPRSSEPHRRGQRCAYVMTGKGCVSRCTFCHRWIRGYRSYPLDNVIGAMKELKEAYNVGFFHIGDESFGVDTKTLDEFIERVRPLDVLFKIGAMEISTIHRRPDVIRRLKEAGCVQIICGMESGSDKILKIMEKRATSRQNLEVIKLLVQERMPTVHQLVIGMPGENDGTIAETIGCLKEAVKGDDAYPSISINYFQSLPGTPAYEFGRERGIFGRMLDEEEAYLLEISDVDACSPKHYRNITEEPASKVFLWPHRIWTAVTAEWHRRNGRQISRGKVGPVPYEWLKKRQLYFRMESLFGKTFWAGMLFLMRARIYGLAKSVLFTLGVKHEGDRSAFRIAEPRSLRKLLAVPDASRLSVSEANMMPLRMGR